MRSLLLLTTVVVASSLFTACHCKPQLAKVDKTLVITEPTTKDGDNWLLDFGGLKPGATANATLPITLSNQGRLDARVTSLLLRPGSDPAFGLSAPATPATVLVGGELSIQVTYAPRQPGTANGFVDLTTDDPNLAAATVELVAVATAGSVQVCVVDPATNVSACNAAAMPTMAVDFGNVLVGGPPVARLVDVRNIGTADLDYLSTLLSVASSPEFSIVPPQTTATVIAPGQDVEFTLLLTPAAPGLARGTATVSTSDLVLPAIQLQLKAAEAMSLECHLTVTPDPVAFGTVPVGGFAQQTLVVVNDGLLPCDVTGLALAGAAAFTLVGAPSLPAALQPNGLLTFNVQYQPTAQLADTGTLTIASSDPAHPNLDVPLSGTGGVAAPCQLQAVPSPMVFGQTGVGLQATQTLNLWNFGTTTCFMMSATMGPGSSGAFLVGASMMPFVDPQTSIPLTVTYFPHAAGHDTGTVLISAGETPFSLTTTAVPVSGSAISPALCLTPQVLDFGAVAAGSSGDLQFVAQSCGAVPLEVRSLTIGRGSSRAFTLPSPPAVPVTLAPGASTTVTVHYAPQTAGGDLGQVVVASNDGNQPTATVRLLGNVANPCAAMIACTPAQLQFPDTDVGQTSTQSFTCANVGTAAVPLTAVGLQPGTPSTFSLSVPPVTSLVPGQSMRVAVDFRPTAGGVAQGAVEIVSGDCRGVPQVVHLTATGVVPSYPTCPTPTVFSPTVKWEWRGSTHEPASSGVYGQPMVAPLIDTNGDGQVNERDVPAVIFSTIVGGIITSADGGMDVTPPGIMRAVRGDTGAEIWSNTNPQYRVFSTYQPAVADLDGDNVNEIVTGLYFETQGSGMGGMSGKYVTGRLVCFNSDGSVKWLSDWWTGGSPDDAEDDSALSIADLNGDGVPEIILGARVFDADGRLEWVGRAGQGDMGHGAMSVVADLDGDGSPEVIGGNTAYHADGSLYWKYGIHDGLPVVVDTDGDGRPEVVLRNAENQFVVLNFDGTVKAGPFTFAIPTGNGVCPATITAADFDGDGHPEIGIPAGDTYYMYKPDGSLLWSHPIQDFQGQCGAAGTGAFDFYGRGSFAAVYNDAENVYAFNGQTGAVMYQQPRSSATIFEVPVIADVDNDGHADILITQSVTPSLVVLNNSLNDWPATRPMWNQHSYHVTNVAASGAVPRVEGPGWQSFNAYRANVALCQ